MTKIRREQLRKEWVERTSEFQASSQSAKEWCTANNVKINRLRYWLRKFRNEEKDTQYQKEDTAKWLLVSTGTPSEGTPSMVVTIGQAAIQISPGFDSNTFRQLMQILREQC